MSEQVLTITPKCTLFLFLYLGGIFFRNHNNWADGKLHSLQKNNRLRITDFYPHRKLFWHLLCKM